jgi:hypothetical protein
MLPSAASGIATSIIFLLLIIFIVLFFIIILIGSSPANMLAAHAEMLSTAAVLGGVPSRVAYECVILFFVIVVIIIIVFLINVNQLPCGECSSNIGLRIKKRKRVKCEHDSGTRAGGCGRHNSWWLLPRMRIISPENAPNIREYPPFQERRELAYHDGCFSPLLDRIVESFVVVVLLSGSLGIWNTFTTANFFETVSLRQPLWTELRAKISIGDWSHFLWIQSCFRFLSFKKWAQTENQHDSAVAPNVLRTVRTSPAPFSTTTVPGQRHTP